MAKQKLPSAWIYKCTKRGRLGYSWVEDGFFSGPHRVDRFGGYEWVRSPRSMKNLQAARKGDLVFCYQTNQRGIVGMTVAASSGKWERGKCNSINMGPRRIAFDNPVRVEQLKEEFGDKDGLGAFVQGKSQHTFHAVEPRFTRRLIELCCSGNPDQQMGVEKVARFRSCALRDVGAAIAREVDKVEDPVRREIHREAYQRDAKWAQMARKRFGCICMAPNCEFELKKADGGWYIEVHHLKPMFEGGKNSLRNLSVLCPNHHRELHYAAEAVKSRLKRRILAEQKRRLARPS